MISKIENVYQKPVILINGCDDLDHFDQARIADRFTLIKTLRTMKILNLSVGSMIARLHIMSAIVVTLGFLGFMYVGIVIGVALFLLTLMGVQWKHIKYLNPFRHVTRPHDLEWHHRHTPIHH